VGEKKFSVFALPPHARFIAGRAAPLFAQLCTFRGWVSVTRSGSGGNFGISARVQRKEEGEKKKTEKGRNAYATYHAASSSHPPPRTHPKHAFITHGDRSIDRSIDLSGIPPIRYLLAHTPSNWSLSPSLSLSLCLPSRLYLSHSIQFLRHAEPAMQTGITVSQKWTRYREETPIGRHAV